MGFGHGWRCFETTLISGGSGESVARELALSFGGVDRVIPQRSLILNTLRQTVWAVPSRPPVFLMLLRGRVIFADHVTKTDFFFDKFKHGLGFALASILVGSHPRASSFARSALVCAAGDVRKVFQSDPSSFFVLFQYSPLRKGKCCRIFPGVDPLI